MSRKFVPLYTLGAAVAVTFAVIIGTLTYQKSTSQAQAETQYQPKIAQVCDPEKQVSFVEAYVNRNPNVKLVRVEGRSIAAFNSALQAVTAAENGGDPISLETETDTVLVLIREDIKAAMFIEVAQGCIVFTSPVLPIETVKNILSRMSV